MITRGRSEARTIGIAALLAVLIGSPATASAAEAGRDADSRVEPVIVEEILVVGARMPRPIDNVVGHVDVITHRDLVREMATSLSDVTRYTPGVSVTTADSRFGETEITIRGLSGNRVASLIDGVPVPDQFDVGSFANAGQDFLVVDAISRVEILRGPASTLFGNDALGGVVAFVTRDPEEFLGGDPYALGGSALWSGRDDSTTLNGSVALGSQHRGQPVNGVLHVSSSTGHELNRSAVDDEPDHQDHTQQTLFLKTAWTPAAGNRLAFDFSLFDETVETDVSSVLGYGRQFANTTSLQGDDSRTRYAARLGYEFSPERPWLDHGSLTAYWQQVDVKQRTTEIRAPLDTLNQRNFSYETEHVGLLADFDSRFATGSLEHRVAWGASLGRGQITEQRDGYTRNLTTGERSNWMLGEVMPVRDFPESTVDEVAVYLHDEISLGRFTLIPGLRWESYRLDADADPVYAADNPSTRVVDAQESELAPKLGAIWRVTERSQVYGQYAHGFRAQPFEDLNIGFDIALFNYRAIPNPDLEPETSDGVEVGYRYLGAETRFTVALFGTDYDNLIETRANLGRDENGTLIFQSRNIGEARVYGAEVTFSTTLDRWISGLSFDAAASITRGSNRTTDEPLNTVDPAEIMAALDWAPSDRAGLRLVLTAAAAKDDVDDTIADQITTDGYVVVDLTGSFQLTSSIRLDTGLFNAFDKTYWQWSSVRNRTTNDPMVDYLSAPGRYASVSVRVAL